MKSGSFLTSTLLVLVLAACSSAPKSSDSRKPAMDGRKGTRLADGRHICTSNTLSKFPSTENEKIHALHHLIVAADWSQVEVYFVKNDLSIDGPYTYEKVKDNGYSVWFGTEDSGTRYVEAPSVAVDKSIIDTYASPGGTASYKFGRLSQAITCIENMPPDQD